MSANNANTGDMGYNIFRVPQQLHLPLNALHTTKPHNLTPSNNRAFTCPESLTKPAGLASPDTELAVLESSYYNFAGSSYGFPLVNMAVDPEIGAIPDIFAFHPAEGETVGETRQSNNNVATTGSDAKCRTSPAEVRKKPGRKPLTSKSNCKRKAQNRAAQRAFQERKEKHLKGLETKVDQLEETLEAANYENSLLCASFQRLVHELCQYKQRMMTAKTCRRTSKY